MRIYDIAEEIERCVNAYMEGITEVVDGETGEIKKLADYIEELQLEKDEKIKRLALYCKEQKIFIDDLKTEKKRIAEQQASEEKKLQSAMDYLKLVTEGKNVKDPQFTISYRKSEAVEIDDNADVPAEAITMEPKISKTWLKEAIKGGATYKGIRLVERQNMTVK